MLFCSTEQSCLHSQGALRPMASYDRRRRALPSVWVCRRGDMRHRRHRNGGDGWEIAIRR